MSKLIIRPWYSRFYRHLELHGVAYFFIGLCAWYIVEVYHG